ncbi:hypothetical protein [Sphingoaurantiacus capsulatus]
MMKLMLAVALATPMLAPAAMAAGSKATEITGNPALDDTRIICRKTLETGSLVRKNKQCFTAREWDRIAQQTRIGNQKVADQLTTACGQEGGC